MARIRTIKPEFWSDKKVASWPLFTRLLYIGLWTSADDHGRGSAEQARVAAELFPYDLSRDPSETLARVAAGFETLAAEGRVTLYEVRGELFYEVARWKDHQRVDNAGKPRFPTPLDQDARPYRDSRETCGEKPLEQGTGNRYQGTGNNLFDPTDTNDTSPEDGQDQEEDQDDSKDYPYQKDFLEFYEAYPRKQGKRKAALEFEKAKRRRRPEDIIQSAKEFASAMSWQAPKFIPLPATWLHQDRFDDDREAWRDPKQQGDNAPKRKSTSSLIESFKRRYEAGEFR